MCTVAAGTSGSASGSSSPLTGKTVLVLGAGGAGRALAFGAAQAGAKVGSMRKTCELIIKTMVYTDRR